MFVLDFDSIRDIQGVTGLSFGTVSEVERTIRFAIFMYDREQRQRGIKMLKLLEEAGLTNLD